MATHAHAYAAIDRPAPLGAPPIPRLGTHWPAPLDTAFDAGTGVYAPPSAYDYAPDSAATGYTSASSAHEPTSPASSHESAEPAPDGRRHAHHDGSSSSPPHAGASPDAGRKKKKSRHAVPLASDQPLTSQGKERQRVYLACAQCRQRKIRCDGAKPTCEVCIKRGVSVCTYDAAPKRRGPDRQPGARQRLRMEEQQQEDEIGDGGVQRQRRRRRRSDAPPSSAATDARYDPFPYELRQASTDQNYASSSADEYRISPQAEPSPLSEHNQGIDPYQYGATYGQVAAPNYAAPRSAYIVEEEEQVEPPPRGFHLASEPSMYFIRETWWDNLLGLYCAPGGAAHGAATPGAVATRDVAANAITADLRFLFRHSNHWLAFFHVRSFLDTLFTPARRARMQPALVLAALALSSLLQSSELERAAPGRDAAFRIRDAAQGALDASVAARWVDDQLAQAAFLLAVFEVCGHPRHSTQRARDAMVVLDGIIRALALTVLDREDPAVTTYQPPAALPPARAAKEPRSPPPREPDPRLVPPAFYAQQQPSAQPGGRTPCACAALSLGARSPLAREQTPMWLATDGWSNDWDEGQVRKEACRRLCWSALGLAAGHTSYASAVTGAGQDLTITNPANFALFFNGEAMSRSVNHGGRTGKDTVWALYNRVMLLWHGCLRLRADGALATADKAQLAMAAWLELDAIEAALDGHTCGTERAYMFQGREVIFNTRMAISYEYQKFMPDVMTNFDGFFHRARAEDWLRRQLALGTGMMQNFGDLTGLRSNMLTYRPFFSLWLMAQVSRCLMLWRVDPSLTLALEVAETWLPPLEYLLAVWPSAAIRERYTTLRQQLVEACVVAGYKLPPPSTVAIATPARAL